MQKSQRPKRPRALQACEVCRTRKNRCDEQQPCTYCLEHQLECKYSRLPAKRQRQTSQSMERTDRPPLGCTAPLPATADVPFNTSAATADIPFSTSEAALGQFPNSPPSFSPSASQSARGLSIPFPREPTLATSTAVATDTNANSRSLEFYGASSSVTFLRHIEKIAQGVNYQEGKSEPAVDSMLHESNTRWQFSPATLSAKDESMNGRFYFRVARKFIDAYFSNIHCIQPIFEEERFLERCEDLWFDRPDKQPLSFIGLYYATLSLGSLVTVWGERETYDTDRFSWSRKFFKEALDIVSQLTAVTDLEMVQCYYMMSKVCQHELNPHVAYLYSGQATRTALATGINMATDEKAAVDEWIWTAAKTWWAVYCLDIHISFALGRPDSLGLDEYHTQLIPGTEDISNPDVLHIISCNVNHARIMRKVGLLLYTRPCSVNEKLQRASELDADLSRWLEKLPFQLNRRMSQKTSSLKPQQQAGYVDKQFIVSMIRYYNLRMIIHAKFLTISEPIDPGLESFVTSCQNICIDSAGQAIDLIHEIYRTENFFQTWWYNSTYTLFAASILLTAIFHKFARTNEAVASIFGQIGRAIEVLEVMDECTVTRNATLIIRRTVTRARKVAGDSEQVARDTSRESRQDEAVGVQYDAQILNDLPLPGASGIDNVDPDFGWSDVGPFNDTQQALFWGEWARYLEVLGA
ncbi:fungal-specific transcription factor domain-containing protein [Aspergillus unguis]